MKDIEFFPWYINTRRLSSLAKVYLPVAAQQSVADNSEFRAGAMAQAAAVANELVRSGVIPNLEVLLAKGAVLGRGRVIAAIWANAIFRGAARAFTASHAGKLAPKPEIRLQVLVADTERWLAGQLEIEHFYSTSAVSYLSNRKQVYVVGQFDMKASGETGSVYPWLIGDLVEDVGFTMSWGGLAEVHPPHIDQFAKMQEVGPPAESQLRKIMAQIPEAAVKAAFAEIIGEPFVPKDWGGERSDLFSSRLTIEETELSAAFLLKGPAVRGPLHPSDLGLRGDQMLRLFEEPADMFVLQHAYKIETTTRKLMRILAMDGRHPRRYCVIDGADTYRILRAYGFLSKDGKLMGKKSRRFNR